ncbi:MAG: hypothetical protein ACUVWA_15275, partial [Candidatus Oleimicrobiaceae bacterium]
MRTLIASATAVALNQVRRQASLVRAAALAAAAAEASRKALNRRGTQRLEEAEEEVSRRTGARSIPTAEPSEGNAVSAGVTPAPGVARESGGEGWRSEFGRWQTQLQARAVSRLGTSLRGFALSEEREGLISGMVAAASQALAGTTRAVAQIRLPQLSLEQGINSLVQRLGRGVDRAVAGIHRRIMTMGNSLDSIANGRLLRPVNSWASGELGREIASQGGIRGVLRNAWDDLGERAQGIGQPLRRPNSPQFTARLNLASGVSALTSLAATIAFGRTGQQAWRDVAGVSDLVGAGLALVGLRGTLAEMSGRRVLPQVARAATRFAGLARAAVRVSGALSAVT